jgi:hypothetical protein
VNQKVKKILRPQTTTSALKQDLQMAEVSANHVLKFDNFMDRSMEFEHSVQAVVAQHQEVFKDTEQ